jgi:hypothetical protein
VDEDNAVDEPEAGSPYALGYHSGQATWQDIVETGSWYAKRVETESPPEEPAPVEEPTPAQNLSREELVRQWARDMPGEMGTISGMQQQPPSPPPTSPSYSAPQSPSYASSRAREFQARATRSERRPGTFGSVSGGRGARQAHLTLSRLDPWSVLKFSSVAAVVAFVVLFVAVLFIYLILSGMGVFDSLQNTTSSITSSQSTSGTNISGWFSASTILGYTALLGVINIVLIPALCTVGAVIYNLIADFFGGIEVTLKESD